MTRILFMRHAKKAHPGINVGLGDDGRIQADKAVVLLNKYDIGCVVSSPLLRASETAQIVCNKIGLQYTTDIQLEERRVGGSTVTSKEIFASEWAQTELDRDYIPAGGESSRMAGKRLEQALIEIINNCKMNSILIVSHGGIICDFLMNHRLIPHTGEASNEILPLASITEVSYDGLRWNLISLGSV